MATVMEAMDRINIPWCQDTLGNIIVGVDSVKAYKNRVAQPRQEPLRVFIAHMDHPGFHGSRWLSTTRLKVRWYGGSPTRHLRGSRVWIADRNGPITEGHLVSAQLSTRGQGIVSAEVRLSRSAFPSKRPAATTLHGGFNFRAPLWRQGKRIYTRAADDLVGVFAILETARYVASKRCPSDGSDFIGLLTRAEEVGFVGAIGHFELGWLHDKRRPVVCVSLEASRTLVGAKVGKGPVVRLGDRKTAFDPGGLKVLSDLANKLLPTCHQRRIMDGGACEAYAATAYNFSTIGVSVPLGNYHNQGFEGGPDCKASGGPAPEFVHSDDVSGLLRLCRGVMTHGLEWASPWEADRKKLKKLFNRYQRLL